MLFFTNFRKKLNLLRLKDNKLVKLYINKVSILKQIYKKYYENIKKICRLSK